MDVNEPLCGIFPFVAPLFSSFLLCLFVFFFFFFHWVLVHPANLPIAEGFIKSVCPPGSKIGTHPTRWPQNTKTRGGEYQWGVGVLSHTILLAINLGHEPMSGVLKGPPLKKSPQN